MGGFLFSLGMIWVLVGAGSILLGPFVGFNRSNAKIELIEFYEKMPVKRFRRIPVLLVFWVALLGFFLPAVYPIGGIIFGCLFFAFS